MIPTKTRESRRMKALKLPKNLERLYKEGKCRECAVVVTRMDFAKILGKFTKVKIQYESSTNPKSKQNTDSAFPNSNVKLKSNENGMVLIHRKTLSEQSFKEHFTSKKPRNSVTLSPVASNILKENNRLKKPLLKDKNSNYNQQSDLKLKHYGIVFESPLSNNNNNIDSNCKITLTDLVPQIDDSILPSEEWCIDYFPKNDEPKDDQVYDRIAAELEDLMYSEKPIVKIEEKPDVVENKVDEFPSIMDILNDNSSVKPNDQSSTLEFKSNLESSDVEAMLLGKSNATPETAATPMEVDNTSVGELIEDVNVLNVIQNTLTNDEDTKNDNNINLPASSETEEIENPHSPSILDEALQKGIEEHLPIKHDENPEILTKEVTPTNEDTNNSIDIQKDIKEPETKVMETDIDNENSQSSDNVKNKEKNFLALKDIITHIVFKKMKEGACSKSVTCPKNLKYCVEIEEKSVEFLGAPKFITSLEDLKVLLQIVNESDLDSLYVLH